MNIDIVPFVVYC